MNHTEEDFPTSSPVRTFAVLALLLLAAGFFSYLWAYALGDAMVAGHLATITPSATDPRPAQMEYAFIVIMSVLLLIAAFMKWSSVRQIRRIDAMNRE